MADQKHVVIVGAGFGGVRLAKELAKENVRITLVDRHNYHLFQPLLYQVSTAVLSAGEIAYPTREFFKNYKNVEFFLGKATGVDQERRVLMTNHGEIAYDYLVLAAGATTNFFGNESVARNSYAMKTLQEAMTLRSHIIHEFERASKKTSPSLTEERRRHLNFVIVGGGATGIEMAGALMELIQIFKKEFHSINFDEVHVTLLEAMGSVLPMVPPDLQQYTIDVLRKKGVDVRLNTAVTEYDGNDLKLNNGDRHLGGRCARTGFHQGLWQQGGSRGAHHCGGESSRARQRLRLCHRRLRELPARRTRASAPDGCACGDAGGHAGQREYHGADCR